jgi:hypothetical protein
VRHPTGTDGSRSWTAIDWSAPVPPAFLVPEHHYQLAAGALDPGQRVRLNHLAVCFSCELFIHFERYLIATLEARGAQVPGLSTGACARFIAEERVHVDAFFRLLERIRPDLYRTRALRFLRWRRRDDLLVSSVPLVSFFLLATLFEEITLYVPAVMEERLDQSFPLVLDVMRLHAEEERHHVALDRHVLDQARSSRSAGRIAGDVLLVLPLLQYMDRQVRAGWAGVVDQFCREERLAPAVRRALLVRSSSRSDLLGMQSFAAKLRSSGLAGAGLLARVIEGQAR